MKKLFLLIILLYTIPAYSQWWVKGGNLIWPKGDVEITKGNLTLKDGYLNVWYGNLGIYEADLYLESGAVRGFGYVIKFDTVSFYKPSTNTVFRLDDDGDYSELHINLDDHGNYEGSVAFDMNVEEGISTSSPYVNIFGSDQVVLRSNSEIQLNGKTDFSGGSYKNSSSVSDPPLDSELTTVFGSKKAGFIGYLNDTGNSKYYLISSNGSSWFYQELTKAL
jgi:hypothetical protein